MRIVRSLVVAALIGTVTPVHATVIADSVAEFSGAQGADGWFYGYYNQGAGGTPHGYGPGAFVEFDTFDTIGGLWSASDAQVGAQNNDFLRIDRDGGHPTGDGPGPQDSVIWAIRRYQSEVAGIVGVDFDLRKLNVFNPRGGGITGRVFVDGAEVFTQLIDNTDDIGVQLVIPVSVSIGSFIDFAIDPTGVAPQQGGDGIFSARADGSLFRAQVCTPAGANPCLPAVVSAPPTPWWLLAMVAGALVCRRHRARR